jgi:long-chain fatty acid transport protein
MKLDSRRVTFPCLLSSSCLRGQLRARLTGLILSAGISLPAWAEGFRNPPAGAFNLGRAGGRITQIDDASAIAQNPANLVDLPGPDFVFAPSIVYIHIDYQSLSGANAETKKPWKLLPNGFASLPFLDGRFAAGLGITTPYGLSNEWEEKGAFADLANPSSLRYQAPHFTELKTINFNPTLSARLCDCLTAGIGLDVFWSELSFKQFLTPLAPDLEARAKGDGVGVGGNLGITWHITERQRAAVTFRSQIDVDYDGHFDLKDIPIVGNSRSDFGSRLRFPNIVAVGYGIKLTDTIRLESDVEWIQFSRFHDLPIDVGSNPIGFTSTSIPQDWKDTFTAGISGDWEFAPGWTARAGYQFYESPVPDHTFSPTIPDANQNVLTVGLRYAHKHHSLEFAYGADFYDRRNISNDQNPAFNGTYDITVHLFAFNYRYSF